jgi:DegV family protein with EDD domain
VTRLVKPHRSYKITLNRIAETALAGARGNSGIIFAQFLYGLSSETEDVPAVSFRQFAQSVRNSVKYVYEALATPVEGTMLTVIREWADYIYSQRDTSGDFVQSLLASSPTLERSLEATRETLAVLARANVVDAGARGFVLFVKGILDFTQAGNIRKVLKLKPETRMLPENDIHIQEEVGLRYCTEAILKHCHADSASVRRLLEEHGDSVVVAGSDALRHVHVHTDDPAALFHHLREFGTLTFQKADDMLRQSETVYRRKWKIALVTDSTCDLPRELIDRYQIHMQPIHISFGENQYLDKVTLQPEQFYRLLDSEPHFPKTSQINEQSFVSLYSHLASHYDSIIAVHLTGHFSGTCHNSSKAAETISREFGKPVTVIDSKNLSGALGLIVLRMAQAIEAGMTHRQVVEKTQDWIRDTRIFVSVSTIKYMVKGGRVSHFRGLMARILNINPIITMDPEGKSMVFGKAYSQQANMDKVMAHVNEITAGRPVWNHIVLHAGNPSAAGWFSEKFRQLTGKEPVSVVEISPVIGANAGLGAASVAFMYE